MTLFYKYIYKHTKEDADCCILENNGDPTISSSIPSPFISKDAKAAPKYSNDCPPS